MSIKETVEDAEILKNQGRLIGAFGKALIAVGASSKKKFPAGTKSRINPKDKMHDGEAFKTFLGTELRRYFFAYAGVDDISSGMVVGTSEGDKSIEDILYVKFRCSLLHEAKLPDEVDILKGVDVSSVSISKENGKLLLGDSWVDHLIQIVKTAACNGEEFGVVNYRLKKSATLRKPIYPVDCVRDTWLSRGLMCLFHFMLFTSLLSI